MSPSHYEAGPSWNSPWVKAVVILKTQALPKVKKYHEEVYSSSDLEIVELHPIRG